MTAHAFLFEPARRQASGIIFAGEWLLSGWAAELRQEK